VVLTTSLQLHLIELPKADRLRQALSEGTQPAVLADWIAYFEHWQEDTIMNAITHEPIRQALRQLHDLSADEEAQRMAFVRERALRDEKSELQAARQEGRQEGQQQGRAAVLARLLQLKFGPLSESTQQRLDQADEARLDVWTERILSAQSVDDVFA
jgi:predicted transposase/invertase (TIGR01784 family)